MLHDMIHDSLFEGSRLMQIWRDIFNKAEKAEGVAQIALSASNMLSPCSAAYA